MQKFEVEYRILHYVFFFYELFQIEKKKSFVVQTTPLTHKNLFGAVKNKEKYL